MKKNRLGNIDQEIEDLDNAFEMNMIDNETYQQRYQELTALKNAQNSNQSRFETAKESDTKKRMSNDDFNFYSQKNNKPKAKTQTKAKKNAENNYNCDDKDEIIAQLRKEIKAVQSDSGMVLIPKRKERKAIKRTKANLEAQKNRKKTPKTEKQSQSEQPKKAKEVSPEKEKEIVKTESKKQKITEKEGKAVMEFSVVRSFANSFAVKIGKIMPQKWADNLLLKIAKANNLKRFSVAKNNGEVVNKIYQYLQNDFEATKNVGDGMAESALKMVREVAKSEFLPLSVQYVKSYLNLTKTKNENSAAVLLKKIENAKKAKTIKVGDLMYAELNDVEKLLKANKFILTENLSGIGAKISGLQGFVNGLQGLGMIESEQEGGYAEKKTLCNLK